MILLWGHNQLIKGYQITENGFDKFFWWDTHTNKILVWGITTKKVGNRWLKAIIGTLFVVILYCVLYSSDANNHDYNDDKVQYTEGKQVEFYTWPWAL